MVRKTTIGVLALQGDFLEHLTLLKKIGVSAKEVRLPKDLVNLDGIIMPGGESTTMATLLDVFKLREPLTSKIKNGIPVWGTCAGMILLAKKLVQDRPTPLGLMDITVNRNAYGRQIDSFTESVAVKLLGNKPLLVSFIRAPIIEKIGSGVEVLAKVGKEIVVIKQRNMLGTTFHSELTSDTRMHEYFVSIIKNLPHL